MPSSPPDILRRRRLRHRFRGLRPAAFGLVIADSLDAGDLETAFAWRDSRVDVSWFSLLCGQPLSGKKRRVRFVDRVFPANFVERVFPEKGVFKVQVNLIDDELFVIRSIADEGSNGFGPFEFPRTLEKLFSPFEKLWHCPRQGILGDQDTMVLRKNSDTSILAIPENVDETYTLDFEKKVLEKEIRVEVGEHTRLVTFVAKTGHRLEFLAKISVLDGAGSELGKVVVPVRNTRDEVYYTASLHFEASRDETITIRYEVEPDRNCKSGQVHFQFTSIF